MRRKPHLSSSPKAPEDSAADYVKATAVALNYRSIEFWTRRAKYFEGYTAIKGDLVKEATTSGYIGCTTEFDLKATVHLQVFFDLFHANGIFSARVPVAPMIYKGKRPWIRQARNPSATAPISSPIKGAMWRRLQDWALPIVGRVILFVAWDLWCGRASLPDVLRRHADHAREGHDRRRAARRLPRHGHGGRCIAAAIGVPLGTARQRRVRATQRQFPDPFLIACLSAMIPLFL